MKEELTPKDIERQKAIDDALARGDLEFARELGATIESDTNMEDAAGKKGEELEWPTPEEIREAKIEAERRGMLVDSLLTNDDDMVRKLGSKFDPPRSKDDDIEKKLGEILKPGKSAGDVPGKDALGGVLRSPDEEFEDDSPATEGL